MRKNSIRFGQLISFMVLVIIAAMACPAVSYADNPTIQTIYTADPAPMVYNGTVYLYADHDEDKLVNNFFTMNDWYCYSSTDMVNWTDHGKVMSLETFSWAKSDAWAGQCIERNGKFYYYVPVTTKAGGNAIGVGVSDSPTGPFVDAIGKPLVSSKTNGDIDPTVFLDEDGQAYLYWGNPNLWYVKLNEDMISYDTSGGNFPTVPGVTKVELTTDGFGSITTHADRTTSFEEGPWFYKRGDLYYMVYAGGGIPENISYSTSTSPTGPWTFKGIIMASKQTIPTAFTNHAGIIDFKGNSYFFYHNQALPGGGGFQRSIAIEQFTYNEDGSFPTILMTKNGVDPVSYLDPYVRNEGETICYTSNIDATIAKQVNSGVNTEICDQGGMDAYQIDHGDYIKVRSVDFGTYGANAFSASVSCTSEGGNIELHLDSMGGTLIGTLGVSTTSGIWQVNTTEITNAIGVHDLYLVFKGGTTGDLFKLDNWQFSQALKEINLNKNTMSLTEGNSEQLVATVVPEAVQIKEVQWTSSDPSVAVVDAANGVVTAVSKGTATITAGAMDGSGIMATCTVTVNRLVQRITLANMDIIEGSSAKLTATVMPDTATNKNIKWTSSDLTVATVSVDGTVTAGTVGTTSITAETQDGSGVKATCTVTVTAKKKDVFIITTPITTPITSLITYQLNGGQNNGLNPSTYKFGTQVTLTNPTRAKYVFAGWYSDSTLNTKVQNVLGADVTVYAKWDKISVSKAKINSLKNKKTKQAQLAFAKISGAQGYEVVYATNKLFKNGKKLDTKNRSLRIKKLKRGKNYYVKVRAYKIDSSGNKVYGKYSTIKKVKVK